MGLCDDTFRILIISLVKLRKSYYNVNKDCKEGHLFIINAVCMCVLCVPMSVCCVWVAFVVAVVRVLSCVCTAHV